MNMIQKTYDCVSAMVDTDGEWHMAPFKVSAWHAMGSDTVNLRLHDGSGWYPWVITEKLSQYICKGVQTMDDLIGWLYELKS